MYCVFGRLGVQFARCLCCFDTAGCNFCVILELYCAVLGPWNAFGEFATFPATRTEDTATCWRRFLAQFCPFVVVIVRASVLSTCQQHERHFTTIKMS